MSRRGRRHHRYSSGPSYLPTEVEETVIPPPAEPVAIPTQDVVINRPWGTIEHARGAEWAIIKLKSHGVTLMSYEVIGGAIVTFQSMLDLAYSLSGLNQQQEQSPSPLVPNVRRIEQ